MLQTPVQDMYPRVSRHLNFNVRLAALRFDNLQINEFGRFFGQIVGFTHVLTGKLVYACPATTCAKFSGYDIAIRAVAWPFAGTGRILNPPWLQWIRPQRLLKGQ